MQLLSVSEITDVKFYYVQTARIWDIQKGETKMDFRGHDHVVECAIFLPVVSYPFIWEWFEANVKSNKDQAVPGQYLLTGSRDKTIKLWDTGSGQLLSTLVSAVGRGLQLKKK